MGKRILYIGGFNLPDNNAAAQRVIANSKLFCSLGNDMMLIGLTSDVTCAKSSFVYEGLRCTNLPYPQNMKEWSCYLTSIKMYREYLEKFEPDILIAYNHPSIALDKLRKYCKVKAIKIISDCTEWYMPQGTLYFKIIKGLDISYRMKVVHKKLDGIIVISEYLNNYYSKCNNVLLLPPLVDRYDEKWRHENLQDLSDKYKLVYAGSPGKGNKDRLDIIIKVLERVKSSLGISLEFDVIGITLEEYHSIYSVNSVIPPDFIHFLGRINHSEVLCKLSKSDFQIFIREKNIANTAGFPTKFVESVSSKVLVLTNFSSDLSKYLIEGKNGYSLDIETEASLYNSLMKVLNKPLEEIRELKKGINSGIFDYREYIAKTRDFLNSLI